MSGFKAGSVAVFRTVTDSELRSRNGQRVTVMSVITEPDATHDAEVLPMYRVRFRSDGHQTETFGDELLRPRSEGPHIEARVRDLIVSVVGETQAANIDLSRVTRHRDEKDLTVGDSHFDGCLTVGPSDYVDVWVKGNPVASRASERSEHSEGTVTTGDLPAHVPGAFRHFKDIYDTAHGNDLVAWATTARSMPEADPGISVTRRLGGDWLAYSDASALDPDWGMLDGDPDELDTEAADSELASLGYRRTGDWTESGGQWAADVVGANNRSERTDDLTGRVDRDAALAWIVTEVVREVDRTAEYAPQYAQHGSEGNDGTLADYVSDVHQRLGTILGGDDQAPLTLFAVGTDAEDAKGTLVFDSAESAESFATDNPGTSVFALDAWIDWNSLRKHE